jgi:hypothetical protein
MAVITKGTQIIMFCPAHLITGGTELMHQFVSSLICKGVNAALYYFNDPSWNIPQEFSKYEAKKIEKVNDITSVFIVLPESDAIDALKFKKASVAIWWLSIDNYYKAFFQPISLSEVWTYSKNSFIKELLRRIYHTIFKNDRILFNNYISLKKIHEMGLFNFYQSEYAKDYLMKKNMNKLYPLKDYINTEFNESVNSINRKNIILYNPAKGLDFTKKIINKCNKTITFIALKGLSRLELKDLMQSSKLYIDFGNHPGKDRLPREAALNGCCVITGRRGSANYYDDVPIPAHYKFEDCHNSIPLIVETINDIMANYDKHSHDFDKYRLIIQSEKKDFEKQINILFIND